MPDLSAILADNTLRRKLFPVVDEHIFLSHAAVAPLSGPARDALIRYANEASTGCQERGWIWNQVAALRSSSAQLLGVDADEISLIGPTAAGLNTVALGLDWQPGDEVIYYADDYPANVYPWADLERRGVRPVPLRPSQPGLITPELVAAAMSERTRLIALASCHFLTGYRIDITAIGQLCRQHGALFSLDGIQTLGAFPTPLTDVDFCSADSHKWLLGPAGAGLFYCDRRRFAELRPSVLGSWNVVSPDFIAQDHIAFHDHGQRYEPGTLNLPGVVAMQASIELLNDLTVAAISARLLHLRAHLLNGLRAAGWQPILGKLEDQPGAEHWRSAIVTVNHPSRDSTAAHRTLERAGIISSCRHDANGQAWLRLSPHAYLSEADLDQAIAILSA
ncbi:MAG: aminotransferase class V-fold PLP-dependent enzyme [Planctomycetota bacterium]|jgi:selenocysteine lyase/cysteine desulfurase